MPVCKCLNGFWLKILMIILMFFDHIYYFMPSKELYFMHVLARVVAPVFAFLMVQGMIFTRSRKLYILRLFAFAAMMSLGNAIVQYITDIQIPNNIFLSLAIGASIIYLVDKAKQDENSLLYAALAVCAVILSFYCEGSFLMPLTAFVYYYFRFNKLLMHTVYVISSGLPFLLMYSLTGKLQAQFYMIFAVIPIMLYNGRRGPDTAFAKYFFYIFYPAHIWIIVLIRFYLST